MEVAYAIAPFAGWFVAGTVKFVIDFLRTGRLAWDQPGLGGLPGTHTAVVSSTAVLVGLRQGIHTALFSVAVTLAIIVMLDALHVRREVGAHAAALNDLLKDQLRRRPFREQVGHRRVEVVYDALSIKQQAFWLDLKPIVLSCWITFRGKWESRDKKF